MAFEQAFGSALNANLHFHAPVLDGVYERGEAVFHAVPAPTTAEVQAVVNRVRARVEALLRRRGLLDDEGEVAGEDIDGDDDAQRLLVAASVAGREALEAALFAALDAVGLPRPKPAWRAGMGAEGSAEFGVAAMLDWHEGDAEEPRISANLTLFLKRLDWSSAIAAALVASRALAPHVDWLLLSRMNSDGPTFLPDAPLLRYHGHVLVATHDLIQSRYEADPVHWPAGVSVEEIEGRILVSRGVEAVDDLDFLRLALPQTWALARQARAKATRYYGPPTAAEREIHGAAPAVLHAVGYDPLGQRLEYSCFLEPDDHLAGWEVDALRWRLEKGALDTGEPVKIIQVVPCHKGHV